MSKSDGKEIVVKFDAEISNKLKTGIPDIPEIADYEITQGYGSTATINLPASTQQNDLLIAFFAKDDDPMYSLPEGWNVLCNTGYSSDLRVAVLYQIYEGGPTNFELTFDDEEFTCIVVRIPYGDTPVINSIKTGYSNGGTPYDINSGFEPGTETLYLVFAGVDYRTITAFPDNMPNNIALSRSGIGAGLASILSTNTLFDPSRFYFNANDEYIICGLAVRVKTPEQFLEEELLSGVTLTGEEHKYVGGPLLQKTYEFDTAIKYEYVQIERILDFLELSSSPEIFESNPINLTGDYRITWDEEVPADTSVLVEYTTGLTQGSWTVLSDNDLITVDTNLWVRATLETTGSNIPIIENLRVVTASAQKNYIKYITHNTTRFHNVIGSLQLDYNYNEGKLIGRGGKVEAFNIEFTPTDLIRVPNPICLENILLGATSTVDFTVVTYNYRYCDETLELSASASFVFTDVEEVNP